MTFYQKSSIFRVLPMQDAGVPTGIVQNFEDLMARGSHMEATGFYPEVEHRPTPGNVMLDRIPFKLSATPWSLHTPIPLLGEHTGYVSKGILGMAQEEIDRFTAEGTFE